MTILLLAAAKPLQPDNLKDLQLVMERTVYLVDYNWNVVLNRFLHKVCIVFFSMGKSLCPEKMLSGGIFFSFFPHNHRMVGVVKDLWGSSGSTPYQSRVT